ncbi:hypothetical protein ACFYXC_35570 [Streptomyces sp. NPDC002701]|uniref:hypothetical protein n=1 Tax=Streptomyces sp. NPDC002701 TaxID=3364661 RepID=UPI003679822D
MLLYAQPVSRIVRLSVDDVIRVGESVLLRLGDPASPVPAPVADLLLEHIANRDNMNTATNPAPRWLFPGRRGGQSSRPDHLPAALQLRYDRIDYPIGDDQAERFAVIRRRISAVTGEAPLPAMPGCSATG